MCRQRPLVPTTRSSTWTSPRQTATRILTSEGKCTRMSNASVQVQTFPQQVAVEIDRTRVVTEVIVPAPAERVEVLVPGPQGPRGNVGWEISDTEPTDPQVQVWFK